MATFDSAGAGFSRGFARGSAIRAQREQAEQIKQARKQDQIRQSINDSEKATDELFDNYVKFASEAGEFAGVDAPEIQQIRQGALAAAMSHASILEGLREQARAFGAPEEQVEIIPSGLEYVQRKMMVLNAALDTARLRGEATPADQSQFFADVEGIGEARVRSVENPNGGIDFFVGDQKVNADQIRPTTQRRQEVNELQIPGLTASQSGQEITELRQLGAANNAFARVANRVAQEASESPEKLSTVGDAIRAFSSLVSQAEAVQDVLGLESRWETENGEPATVEDFDFRSLAEASADVKRTLLDLVFLDLASKGQTGRAVSDRDLAIFMDRTGIDSGDPRQVIAGLKAGVGNNQAIFKENVLGRSGGAFTADKILPQGLVKFNDPATKSVLTQGLDALDEAIASGDLERFDALADAIEARDEKAIKKLLDGGS